MVELGSFWWWADIALLAVSFGVCLWLIFQGRR
jgi:hypothetical protein